MRKVKELVAGSASAAASVLRVVVETTGADGLGAATYQLLLGVRPERPRGLLDLHYLGEVPTPDGRRAVYDALAHPDTALLVGASRKRMTGAVIAHADGSVPPAAQRDAATAALSALVATRDVWCVRVHDVSATLAAVRVAAAWNAAQSEGES